MEARLAQRTVLGAVVRTSSAFRCETVIALAYPKGARVVAGNVKAFRAYFTLALDTIGLAGELIVSEALFAHAVTVLQTVVASERPSVLASTNVHVTEGNITRAPVAY